MKSDRQKRLASAQLVANFAVPFFSPAICRLPVSFDDSIPTACTDGQRIRWNGGWFDALPDDVLVTVLCHEACHCLLGHLWRMAPPMYEHQRANVAADHAVNLMLKEFGAIQTDKGRCDPFPFPTDFPALCDPAFSGMAEEVIYAKLPSNPSPNSGGAVLCIGVGGAGNGKPTSRQGLGGKNAPTGNVGSNNTGQNLPTFGEFEAPAVSQEQAKTIKTEWERVLIQSVEAMKGRGNLPASIERMVKNLVSPQVDWWNLLRSWLREQCSDDWDFQRPAMEYSECGFMLPSLRSEKMGPVVFGSDWSGSTSEFIGLIHAEKQNCLDQMRPSKLLDMGFDTEVQWVKEYVLGDEIDRNVNCGGGTSFVAMWKEIEKRGITPKCVVVVTDLEGEFGKDPGYPVLWVSWIKDGKAPFGEVIYCEQK